MTEPEFQGPTTDDNTETDAAEATTEAPKSEDTEEITDDPRDN